MGGAQLFREGRELATRSGDPHVLGQVLFGFGYRLGWAEEFEDRW